MASSTQSVPVPESDKPEAVKPSPEPETKATPFVIKLAGPIPQ